MRTQHTTQNKSFHTVCCTFKLITIWPTTQNKRLSTAKFPNFSFLALSCFVLQVVVGVIDLLWPVSTLEWQWLWNPYHEILSVLSDLFWSSNSWGHCLDLGLLSHSWHSEQALSCSVARNRIKLDSIRVCLSYSTLMLQFISHLSYILSNRFQKGRRAAEYNPVIIADDITRRSVELVTSRKFSGRFYGRKRLFDHRNLFITYPSTPVCSLMRSKASSTAD